MSDVLKELHAYPEDPSVVMSRRLINDITVEIERLRDYNLELQSLDNLQQMAIDKLKKECDELRAELAAEREAKQCAVDQAETFREERDAAVAQIDRLNGVIQTERELTAQAQNMWLDEQSNRIAAEAERDAMREALKPFALMATELEYEGSKWLDHETHWLKCFDFQLEPTVGDLRRARAALKGDDRE